MRISWGFILLCWFCIDNLIVDNAGWIGQTRIQGLAVSGAGTTTQFDPSTGSNYECVNEVPYSDTDYCIYKCSR